MGRITPAPPGSPFDIGAYLRRIGYMGPTDPTVETLAGLTRAQLEAVPFENLDIIPLGRPLRLDPAGLFQKMVEEQRGGFCFELNGLFALLLEALGFGVIRVACQFAEEGGYSHLLDHLALLVTTSDGDLWFIDVGAGRTSLATPLAMPGPDATGPVGPPDPADGAITRIERRGAVGHVWRREADGEWVEHLRFDPSPHTLSDFADRCRCFETEPDSHFRSGPICTRLTPEGWISIRPGMLTITAHGERAETPLAGDGSLQAALRTYFAIDLHRFQAHGSPGEIRT